LVYSSYNLARNTILFLDYSFTETKKINEKKEKRRVTAFTQNCWFSVWCQLFFPIFNLGNGEISVTKSQPLVAAKR
jgi:hypothetical protein